MAQQTINFGTAPDGSGGDSRRLALEKLQANDKELYDNDTALFAATAAANAGVSSITSLKNKIINGKLDVWQAGATVTASGINAIAWGPDRFLGQVYNGSGGGGNSTASMSQQAFTPGQSTVPSNPKYFARLQATALGTLGASSAMVRTLQYIEDVTTLAGNTVTVSVWLKADSARNVGLVVLQNFGSGGSPSVVAAEKSIAVAAGFQKYSVTFALPSVAGKTIGPNSNIMVALYLYKQDNGDGTTIAPIGSWSTAAYLDFSLMRLELGSTTSDLDDRPYALEELLCKRYCTTSKIYLSGRFGNTTSARFYNDYEVPMRRGPDYFMLSTNLAIEATQVTIYTMSGAYINAFSGDTRRAMFEVTGTIGGGTPSVGAMAQLNTPAAVLFRAEF